MTIDMSQFYQVFFEETGEHLANMETLLLALDVDNPSLEDLNAIFRAAHSIKGGSGTFGFTDMTEVTHILETLLDRLRKEELQLRAEMVDAFLAAGDILRAQLEHHQGGPDPDAGQIAEICATLAELASDEAPAAGAVESVQPAASLEPRKLDLKCALPANVAADASAVEGMLAALADVAAVEIKHRPDAADPALFVTLSTLAEDATLRDIFAFHLSADAVSISPAAAKEEAYGLFDDEPAPVAAPAKDEAYGFFTDEPAAPAAIAAPAADAAYGFFDDEPAAPAAAPAATKSDEDGFGFFDAAPGSPDAASSEPEGPTVAPGDSPAAIEGVGYGLFIKAPEGLGLFAGAPGSDKMADRIGVIPEVHPDAHPAASGATSSASPSSATPSAAAARKPSDKPAAAAAAAPAHAAEASSIRVAVEKVDQLINLVGELVITQAMIADAASYLDPIEAEKLLSGIDLLSRNTRDLQESVMSIRMLPMSMVFSRFPRVVRDLAGKLKKEVEMKTIGENTELDKGLIEKIADPLTHLVRNSLDHGLETPDKRVAAGKNPKGTLTLKASHQGGNIVIEVIDDGGGLNRTKILSKAKEKGLNVHDGMTDAEVWQLIMAPGFSTADQITDVSGRGVGMDVVKKNIEGIGGKVELESVTGHGTRIVIRLPLTLAILDGMSVGVGGETFIVPLTAIIESLQPTGENIKTMAGDSRVVHIRGEYLPIIPLAEVLGGERVQDLTKGIFVVLEAEEGKAALFVDELLGQHQVVIKSLEANYRRIPGISGATIMGDGCVALILDVAAVTKMGLANCQRPSSPTSNGQGGQTSDNQRRLAA